MFPLMSSCASIPKKSDLSENMAAVGQLWFFLLLHLLRNYWVDSNETCLLCSSQCLVVQAPNQILIGRQISIFWLPDLTQWNVPVITLLSHLLWNHWTELIELDFPTSTGISVPGFSVCNHRSPCCRHSNPQIYIFGDSLGQNKFRFNRDTHLRVRPIPSFLKNNRMSLQHSSFHNTVLCSGR